MKKLLALLLITVLVATCFTLFSFAEGSDDNPISILPDPDGEITASGCDITVNGNGSVTITLTASTASVKMDYQSGSTIYDEKYSSLETNPLFIFFFAQTDGITGVDIHAKYDRPDKDFATTGGADLYLSGMRNSPQYFEAGTATTNYGAWNIYKYLSSSAKKYPADGILKFFNITYTISGAVGSSVTFYDYGTAASVADDYGTVIPEDVEESSEAAISIPDKSEAPAASSAAASSATSSEKPTTGTGDNGVIALAVVAVLAIAGAVVVRKSR